ncbi:MAG: BBP7 family outer membrane beta-barrel protein [Pirellulales bacterium]
MAVGQFFFRGVTHGIILGTVWVGCSAVAHAQQTRTRAPVAHRRLPAGQDQWEQIPQEGTYPGDEPGVAAGRLIDSLFNPTAPESRMPEILSQALGRLPYRGAARRSSLRGRLVRNPDTINGSAPFVLLDRYGGIQRYIEPVTDIDLEMYEGEIVGVRRDTGDTLLASQLELPRTPGKKTGLQLVDHEELIPAGEPIPIPADENSVLAEENMGQDGLMVIPEGIDPIYLDDGPGLGGCPSCGGLAMHQPDCSQGIRGGRNRFYVQAEYLLWAMAGMDIPPLVVAGEDDGNGNLTNAQIIYGNESILTQGRSGARLRLGTWLGGGPWALEGEYLNLGKISGQFNAGGDGVTPPFIGRPFIDATTGLNAVEDVSFPNPGIRGNVTINIDSEFESGGIWLRRSLYTTAGCEDPCVDDISCDSGVGCGTGVGRGRGLACRWFSRCRHLFGQGTRRLDFLFGFRSSRLRENLGVSENLQTLDSLPTTFNVSDQFSTTNEFTGLEIGYLWGWQNRRWSVDLLSRLALGNTNQQVDIRGSTVRDLGAGPETGAGGLLALPSNIGSYTRDELSVMPELGATLGFALTRRLRLTVGYTFIYWSRVARPGDQIDLEVNPGLLPFAPVPSTIPARPQFVFRDTDIWAQGLNVGADYRW